MSALDRAADALARDDARWRYYGVNRYGTTVSGVISASSEAAAREELGRYYDRVSVTPAGLGGVAELRSTAGRVSLPGEDAGREEKEKFSFTDPDVPLFGREYQETKQRANTAMEKLRKIMEKAPPVKGKDAEYSSAAIREARELIRERERAAGPMTRVQKLLWLEDNMTEVPRGTSRHDIAEILDLV